MARDLAAEFDCDLCGARAGSLLLSGAKVRRESFTSVLVLAVDARRRPALRAALAAGHARGLFAFDFELAPFYCPDCDATYCGEHWVTRDVFADDHPAWHDSIRGTCPRGHERMLED